MLSQAERRIVGNQFSSSIWFMPWENNSLCGSGVSQACHCLSNKLFCHYYLYFENALPKGQELFSASQFYFHFKV